MNCLIVIAHPEPTSFNAVMGHCAEQALTSHGHQVRKSDLYAKQFAPDEHGRHYAHRKDPTRFDAQAEQRFSAEGNVLPEDVRGEIEDLLWADLVVLQFPLWWFGMPAILKGWMDRVFVYGKLYTGSRRFHSGVCRGKRAMLSVTAGSPAAACTHDGQEGDARLTLWPIHYSLHYLGFTVLEPLLVTGVRGGLEGENAGAQRRYLLDQLRRSRSRIADVDAIPAIPFNGESDWDENRKLRPHAIAYSPFIRHHPDWRLEGDR